MPPNVWCIEGMYSLCDILSNFFLHPLLLLTSMPVSFLFLFRWMHFSPLNIFFIFDISNFTKLYLNVRFFLIQTDTVQFWGILSFYFFMLFFCSVFFLGLLIDECWHCTSAFLVTWSRGEELNHFPSCSYHFLFSALQGTSDILQEAHSSRSAILVTPQPIGWGGSAPDCLTCWHFISTTSCVPSRYPAVSSCHWYCCFHALQ